MVSVSKKIGIKKILVSVSNKFGIEKVLVSVLKNDEDILLSQSEILHKNIQQVRKSGNVEVMLSVAGGRKTRIRED